MVSFKLAREQIYKKKLYIFNSFYLLDSCNQSLKWSLLGVKKSLGHALLGVQFKIPEEHPRSFHMGVSPRNSTSLYRPPSPQPKKRNNQKNKQTNKLKKAITFFEI